MDGRAVRVRRGRAGRPRRPYRRARCRSLSETGATGSSGGPPRQPDDGTVCGDIRSAAHELEDGEHTAVVVGGFTQLELGEDVAHVRFDRLGTEYEARGDRFV